MHNHCLSGISFPWFILFVVPRICRFVIGWRQCWRPCAERLVGNQTLHDAPCRNTVITLLLLLGQVVLSHSRTRPMLYGIRGVREPVLMEYGAPISRRKFVTGHGWVGEKICMRGWRHFDSHSYSSFSKSVKSRRLRVYEERRKEKDREQFQIPGKAKTGRFCRPRLRMARLFQGRPPAGIMEEWKAD